MYNTEKFYLVTEANVLASGNIGTQVYAFTGEKAKENSYNKLFSLWAYGVKPTEGETRQLLSASLTEYVGSKAIMLESKVFDYRQPEPEPEPEPEE